MNITLPAGDNAVQITWSNTVNDGMNPYSYVIYGRTPGSQLGLAAVGRNSGGLSWTDIGTITPSGSPNGTDKSGGQVPVTAGVYVDRWNGVTPAMKAVDPNIKLVGPVESGPHSNGGGFPWTDSTCTTTNGLNSSCANGHPGWTNNTEYIPALLNYGNPKPDVVSFHGYGNGSTTPEGYAWLTGPEGGQSTNPELSIYNNTDKAAINAANVPVWITEANIDANYSSNPQSGTDFRSPTMYGSAWMADSVIAWSSDPHVQKEFEFATNGGDNSWILYGETDLSGNTSCIPQPACQNSRTNQPNLEYWTMYEINHLLAGGGKLVNVSGVPSSFSAMAVQTASNKVVMLLVNKQQGNDDGNGAAATVNVNLGGATVSDTQQVAINGSTSWADGPSTQDLGAQPNH